MDAKLVFLDIDGTLLPAGEMDIPSSALDAIRQAQANGHKVFLCTGRNYRMTKPLLQYGFDGYVSSAGGYVVCGDQVLVDCPMEKAQSDGLRAVLEKNGVECTLEARDGTYGGTQMIQRLAYYQQKMGLLNSEAERWRRAMADGMLVRPLSEYAGEPIYKICYIAEHARDLDEARALYEDQFIFCQSNMGGLPDSYVNGELINRKFDKGTGIRAICDHLGMSMADTIGFGDSENDLQMTDVVGVSVCMANGTEGLKKRCDRICPAVTEDGVAREFKALGLI